MISSTGEYSSPTVLKTPTEHWGIPCDEKESSPSIAICYNFLLVNLLYTGQNSTLTSYTTILFLYTTTIKGFTTINSQHLGIP